MTPFEQNYRVPGRFEQHECTFITWPCLTSDLEIINLEKDKYYYSTRAISLANPVVRGLNVQVYTKKEANEVIEILDRKYEVILIKEIVENKKIAWKHENLYWVDPETGFVWKSLQQIAPNVPPISLEITKAPSL